MYKAKVVKVSVKEHPNADRLQLAYASGIQVIVGKDVKPGDIMVFFPCDGKLSNDFLSRNNLYRHSELNSDKEKAGYFSDNGRVTVEKIRGERSDGFLCPLEYFKYTEYNTESLSVGDEFDKLNRHQICKKYYTKATLARINKRSKKTQSNYLLPRHYNTEQLRYNLNKLEVGDVVTITEKLHGTSSRVGNVLVEREIKLNWLQRLLNKLSFVNIKPETISGYEFAVGTRNTIASERFKAEDNRDHYRLEMAEPLRGLLKKGEVIYGELVGYDSYGSPIMNMQNTDKLPELKKKYGTSMMYSYGCEISHETQQKMFVYRITNVNVDGCEVDLTWSQIKKRASELGLEAVPELGRFVINKKDDKLVLCDIFDYSKEPNSQAVDVIENFCKGVSVLDSRHIKEGVCVRLEKDNGDIVVLKDKSFEFKYLEGILKSDENYIDTEEVS